MITTLLGIATASDDSNAQREHYENWATDITSLPTSTAQEETYSLQSELGLSTISTINSGSSKRPECNTGGIAPNSVNSGMQFTYIYPELVIGTIADNYWQGHCTAYDRSTAFEVIKLMNITEFRIVQVGFDDYLWVKVNGHTIYVGPDGGNSLELTQSSWRGVSVANGISIHSCERNTNWNFYPNIDLKPYLIEGKNDIWTRTIVTGSGESWMKILARQQC